MKVYVLCPPSCHFEILRKQQCFDVICEFVLEKDKHEWVLYEAMLNTAGLLELSSEVVSRDTSSKLCFNASHDDITTTEVLNFHQNKICGSIPCVKGLVTIKVGDINYVALGHHVHHSFLDE